MEKKRKLTIKEIKAHLKELKVKGITGKTKVQLLAMLITALNDKGMEGSGILDWAKNALHVIKNPTASLTNEPKQVRDCMAKYGNNIVKTINVCRNPINSAIKIALNAITMGKFSATMANNNYDKMYHLYALLLLDNGVVLITERNQRVALKVASATQKKAKDFVSVVCNKPLNQLINNAVKVEGSAIWKYDPIHNNCQKYISSLLKASGLFNESLNAFINQKVDKLLEGKTHKIATKITNVANVAENIVRGGESFKTYVEEHHHDLEGPHTMKQMYKDYKETKGGGNKASGFIRAIMARNDAPENAKMNKSKFRNFDKQGMRIDKMTKATHDIIKKKVKDPKYKEYLIHNALQHQPLHEGKTNYVGTYDMGQHYTKHKKEEGKEITESRKRKKEEPYEEPFFPEDMFELPKPLKKKRPNVAVVKVENVKKEEKEESKKPEEKQDVIVGKFKTPRDEFEEEINKLVDFGVSHLHFNDLISELANPSKKYYQDTHSGINIASQSCVMYYYITKYKIPIISFTKYEIKLTKDISTREKSISYSTQAELKEKQRQIYGDNKRVEIDSFNTIETIPTKEYNKKTILPAIKNILNNGEKQILLFLSVGTVSAGHHSNLILIRAVEKEVHIIDPHGEGTISSYTAQYRKIHTFGNDLATLLGKDWKYITSEKTCPYLKKDVKRGFQAIENLYGSKMGFCGWWNAFIIEMCCLKPDTPFVEIYEESAKLLSDEPEKLYKAIVHYQWKLQQTIIEIANKAGIETEGRADMQNVYNRVAIVIAERLNELKEKRMKILGYGVKKC